MGKRKKRKKGRKKKPQTGETVRGTKRPAVSPVADPQELPDGRVAWRFRHLDIDGPWCWLQMSAGDRRDVFSKLRQYEQRTWNEIRPVASAGGAKAVSTADIPNKDATDRLTDLELDDRDEIWELRLSSTKRIWGFRDGHVLYLLWWDPDHEVWPSKKKNT